MKGRLTMRTTISITKRGSRYQARVNWYDNQDKRHQKSAGYFDRRKDAVATAERVRDELQEQLNPDLTEITLADYYQRWYQLYKEQGITRITQNRYKVIGNVLTKYFNKKKLKDVRKSDYQAFINWYGADHARDSVNKLNGAVKKMVSFALDDEIIRKDFTSNIQVIANKDRERKVEYLNQKETAVLMDAVKDGLDPDHPVKYMILTALLTGMRKSEIQALTWNDLDFLHSTININKSWDEIEKAFKATKTLSSRRVIPVNRELLKMLASLKANNSTMVFYSPEYDQVPTGNALNKALRLIMHQQAIAKQGFHFHSLRHVHVAYLLGKGVDVYAISKRLGHSDITITLKTYSYLIDEYKAQNDDLIVKKLQELI